MTNSCTNTKLVTVHEKWSFRWSYSGSAFSGLLTNSRRRLLGPPYYMKFVTYIPQLWNMAQLYLPKEDLKWVNYVTHSLISANINIYSTEIIKFCYSQYADKICFLIHFFKFFWLWVFKDCFNQNDINFDDVSKIGCSRHP